MPTYHSRESGSPVKYPVARRATHCSTGFQFSREWGGDAVQLVKFTLQNKKDAVVEELADTLPLTVPLLALVHKRLAEQPCPGRNYLPV